MNWIYAPTQMRAKQGVMNQSYQLRVTLCLQLKDPSLGNLNCRRWRHLPWRRNTWPHSMQFKKLFFYTIVLSHYSWKARVRYTEPVIQCILSGANISTLSILGLKESGRGSILFITCQLKRNDRKYLNQSFSDRSIWRAYNINEGKRGLWSKLSLDSRLTRPIFE